MLGLELETKSSLSFRLKRSVENYFIHLFSLLVWQSLQVLQMVVENHPRTGKPNKCIATYVANWSPFIYDRSVTINRSTCGKANGNNVFRIDSIESRPITHCEANQFQCDDGTCFSHQYLYDWPDECSPSTCVCWLEGRDITDIRYCRDVYTPGELFLLGTPFSLCSWGMYTNKFCLRWRN